MHGECMNAMCDECHDKLQELEHELELIALLVGEPTALAVSHCIQQWMDKAGIQK